MHFKVRVEGKVTSKAFYTVLAVPPEGRKDILELYLSENEGARFWLGVLNDLKATKVALSRERFRDVPVPEIDSPTREAKGPGRPGPP